MSSVLPNIRPIPAITLYEPWASWIALGLKTIETRTHTRFRRLVGQTIAIHAGLRYDTLALKEASRFRSVESLLLRRFVSGAVVCLANVKGFRELGGADSPAALCDCFSSRRYGLLFGRVEKMADPIPATGHQGVWWWNPPGENFIRDLDRPCGQFFAGDPEGECEGDGHYMCRECTHWKKEED